MNDQTPPPFPPPASYNLPASLDVDQNFTLDFSALNLNDSDVRNLLPQNLDYDYGGFKTNAAERFMINPIDENFRVYTQGFCRGVGNATSVMVEHPFDHSYDWYEYRYPWGNNREYVNGASSSLGVDHFDLKSYLLDKQEYNPYHNNTPADQEKIFSMNKDLSQVSGTMKNQQFLSMRSLRELRDMVCYMAKDQTGSRVLRSKFENPTKEEIEFVLSEVRGSIGDLMMDQFGNHIIQKLVSVCNDDQRTMIVYELTKPPFEIVHVCMSSYGTRSIQKLCESLNSRNQIMMVIGALHRSAARLANDPNGHHVLQYCLLHFDNDFNQLIIDDIVDNCFRVATDKSGCCVLQACVEHSRGEVRNRLISEIMANAIHIAEDPFGNYVLQHMVGLRSPELTELLVRQLEGNFASLSRNKYASNVVEKCLTESGPDISAKIILEVVGSQNSHSLLVDPFGNFVIQSAIKVSKGVVFEFLHDLIKRNKTSMQTNLYGKKILERIEKRTKMIQDSSARWM